MKISGFKSFADPVSLEFSKGISAIVGPNGSGKSNITDAIRWVLGEQSIKSLRGKKMEDVIFSGTEKKPPSGYAEVVLVLDNTDEAITGYPQEVAVSRKLFRSGESEYAINKKHCKLKDIHLIFMDTGLGKNGYSLISQGGIESIITSTPGELRSIFEEAVGIVSYKTKKNEAEKKLDQTQTHIDRLMDIFQEIEKQLVPLKKQSEKAQIYKALKAELKIQDLVIFNHQINQISEELKVVQNQYDKQNQSCLENEAEIERIDQVYQERTVENRELFKNLEQDRDEMSKLEGGKERIAREIIQSSSQLEASKQNADRLKHEKDLLEKEVLSISSRIDEKAAELEDGTNTLKELSAQKKVLDMLLKELLEEEVSEKKNVFMQQEHLQATQKTEEELVEYRIRLRTQLQDLSAQVKFIHETASKYQDELDNFNGALEKTRAETEEVSEQINCQAEELNEIIKRKTDEQSRYKKCADTIQVLTNHLKVDGSKVEYLKNIQKNYQDYFPAIRKLMTSDKLLGSLSEAVFGPVGELLRTEQKYLQAIEVSLGAKSQNIVVSTVSAARECIDLLKRQRLGRATFLPLDNLRVSAIDQNTKYEILRHSGVEGFASDLVETDEKFGLCIESLLGRTVVVSNFEDGKSVSKKFNGRFTVVTLEGEIFYPGGAIVGGQNKESKQSPLSKKIEIENLEKDMGKNQERLTKCIKLEGQLKQQLEAYTSQITDIETRIKELKQASWEKNQVVENFKALISERDAGIIDLKKNEIAIEVKRIELLEELSAIEERYEQAKEISRKPVSDEQLNTLRGRIEEKKSELYGLQMKETEKQGEINSDLNEKRILSQQLEQTNLRITQVSKEIYDLNSHQQMLSEKIESLLQQEKVGHTEIEKLTVALTANEELYRTNNEQLATIQEKIKESNHQLIVNNEKKNQLKTSLNGFEIKLAHLEEVIQNNYEMNLIMVEDAVIALQNSEDFEKYEISEERQRAIGKQINAMGNINLDAVKEYEEILSRYSYLKQQIEDLELGKKELLDIISDLYEAMTEQFKINFIKLQDSFSKIFNILFEGGRAYLEFTDPSGVLEGGIELVAQPPGKRLRHISLLSGGEKSMVAIALLFSFLEINPSPFCVIDEIDAALDDHNIFRYINYLKTLSNDNQFITITHRRKTLEVCDDLYGVSMSKEGVSQLVSVRLTDYI
ncbi:chromosome segregation protein SMC [Eubacteriaceae bacterium ES3]|nr:chromosome segregation protein SMC [Eubacteriaceae bacterium ES3]